MMPADEDSPVMKIKKWLGQSWRVPEVWRRSGRQRSEPVSPDGRRGEGVREQVLEVIVRQALAGAPWRDICAGPMLVNNITPEEVEAEVSRRRRSHGKD